MIALEPVNEAGLDAAGVPVVAVNTSAEDNPDSSLPMIPIVPGLPDGQPAV